MRTNTMAWLMGNSNTKSRDRGSYSIMAKDPLGFDIAVYWDRAGFVVWFGGLIQEFSSEDEVLTWVNRACSSTYRLRIDFEGERACRWTLEEHGAGNSKVALSSGHFIARRSTSIRSVYKQNANRSKNDVRW